MNPVLLYSSSYCNSTSVEHTNNRLLEMGVDVSRINKLPDVSYLQRSLDKYDKATLIMPGGMAMYMSYELDSNIDKVRNAVSGGWDYFGLCAGAILGARRYIDTKRDYNSDNVHLRLFDLLPVNANPANFSSTSDDNGSRRNGRNMKEVEVITKYKRSFNCFWQDSPVFNETQSVVVEARYDDLINKLPAAISGEYGKGKVVLSGVHLEINYYTQPDGEFVFSLPNVPYEKEVFSIVKRRDFLKEMFQYAGILS
jgi:glutamine amidotransferase-like uncharacterized protein